MELFSLHDVVFAHPGSDTLILDHVSLSVEKGQRIGLIGPNGSGKTTLLQLIMGLYMPQSGKVIFEGEEMQGEKDFRRLRKKIGLLFQDADDQLFSPTVLEDVAFGPLNLGLSAAEAKKAAMHTLDSLGLAHLAKRVTHQLSGGEKKLVSLATLLVMEPEALLLDEPSNNLDPKTRHRLIHNINDLDLTVIAISHDWDFLAATSKEILTLQDGKLSRSDASILHQHTHMHPQGGQPHHHSHES